VEVAAPITQAIRIVTRRDEREQILLGRIEEQQQRITLLEKRLPRSNPKPNSD